jgi:uncharacterized membrane protein
MATADSLPRMADALREVSDRIREISTELRTLADAESGPDPAQWQGIAPAPTAPGGPPTSGPAPAGGPAPVGGQVAASGPPPARGQAAGGGQGQAPPPFPAWPQFPPPPPYEPTPSLWERATQNGSRILAWAGGAVTLAGVVLLLILAVQRGYLGPLPRVLLGATLGVVLIWIAIWQRPNPHARTGALAATGFAVLYLDVIAATVLFEYLPPVAGLAAGLGVAGLGLLLAARWESQPLAVFVVVCCACAAPFLTGGFVPMLLGFLLVLQICAIPVQLVKRWGGLRLAAGIPPVLAAFIAAGMAYLDPTDAALVAYLGALTSGVQVLAATLAVLRRPLGATPTVLLLLAPTPTMLAAPLLPRAGAIALPATIGVLLVLVWILGRTGLPRHFVLAAGAGASAPLLQATVTAFDGSTLAIVLLAEALGLALVALALRYPAALAAATLFGFVGFAVAIVTALPGSYVGAAPGGRLPIGTILTAGLTGLLLTAAVLATCSVATHLRVLVDEGGRVGWVLGGLVALYGATGTVLSVGLLISPDRSGFLLGHVLVTVSWTVGALVLLLRGIDSVALRVAGLSLVGAALVKLVLFDLSSLDGLARVAAFLVAGLILLGAGTRYARLVAARSQEVNGGPTVV